MSNRIEWIMESPSYTWQDPFKCKTLVGGEIWIDQLIGSVRFIVEYRADQSACWNFWTAFDTCAARDCHEDPSALLPCVDYPQQLYCPAFKSTLALPEPPANCEQSSGRPSNQGYTFQVRLRIRGWCRIRGLLVHAIERETSPYDQIVC